MLPQIKSCPSHRELLSRSTQPIYFLTEYESVQLTYGGYWSYSRVRSTVKGLQCNLAEHAHSPTNIPCLHESAWFVWYFEANSGCAGTKHNRFPVWEFSHCNVYYSNWYKSNDVSSHSSIRIGNGVRVPHVLTVMPLCPKVYTVLCKQCPCEDCPSTWIMSTFVTTTELVIQFENISLKLLPVS